ncbi:glycosyltransferase family 2 protein [Chishuiella changwenlii]|uniref:glycosyltransferase family 2 protein n=1 Tax=Chishuiella changwenlii TaxID=1434701 RepID=UPI002FD94B0A
MTPIISIIVPIYNVEEYLEKCIKTILNQTYNDFELLLIDDGSTDNSEKICAQFLDDGRINYYKKNNGGVSSARNLGLELAKGKYICFIDPDDYVSDNYLEDFIHNIKPSSFVIQDLNIVKDSVIKTKNQGYYNRTIKIPEELNEYIADYKITQGYLVNKIFEKEIINQHNILFNEKIKIGEDEDFCFTYITHINQIILLDKANYFYVQRGNSASKKKPIFESEFTRLSSNLNFLNFLNKKSNHDAINAYIKLRFNVLFNYTLRSSLYYYNSYPKNERIASLRTLSTIDKKYLNILEAKTILQKIDYFLFKKKLFHILDFILHNKSKYN